MPSPFPGMDPFIESQVWEDFHLELISSIRAALIPQVRPRYVVRIEKRIYMEHQPEETVGLIRSDVAVLDQEKGKAPSRGVGAATAAVALEPVVLTLPMPEER